MMGDFVPSNQLQILNEEREITTFQSSRGESYLDLSITNSKMLANIRNLDISEVERALDHNIIKFNITLDIDEDNAPKTPGERLSIKEHQYTNVYEKLQHIDSAAFQIKDREGATKNLTKICATSLNKNLDIQEFTKKLEEAKQTACKETCANRKSEIKDDREDCTMVNERAENNAEKTNALRRYKQTNNEALQEIRKSETQKAKAEFQAVVKKEKTRSC